VDGIVVRVDGRAVEVDWPSAPDESEESWQHLEETVADPLRTELLQVGSAFRLRWTQRRVGSATSWSSTATGSVQLGAWKIARPAGPLDVHGVDGAKLVRHPQLRAAIDEFGRGMEAWE